MAHRLEFTDDGQAVVVKLEGVVAVDDVLRAFGDLTTDGAFVARRRLWDLRGCTLNWSGQDVREMSRVARGLDAGRAKVALLVDGDLSFGLARMYESMRASEETELAVFRDPEEARRWLRTEWSVSG